MTWWRWCRNALLTPCFVGTARVDAIDGLNALEAQIGALLRAKRYAEALPLEYACTNERCRERVKYAEAVHVLGLLQRIAEAQLEISARAGIQHPRLLGGLHGIGRRAEPRAQFGSASAERV